MPHPPVGDGELTGFIRRWREDIIHEWERRMEAVEAARRLSAAELRDHLPTMLDRIAERADLHYEAEAKVGADTERHALHRLEEGFDLEDLVFEYTTVREVLLDFIEEQGPLPRGAMRELHRVLDRALQQAVSRFAVASHRLVQAIDRISTEALGTTATGQLLERLLDIMREASPAVDLAVLFLREDDRLYVRAAVGLVEERDERFSVHIGEGFTGAVGRDRRPRLLRDAAHDPVITSPFMRRAGVRALYSVPILSSDGELIGVANMGSLSAYEFSDEDQALFRALVNRAGALLVESALREREQKARQAAERQTAELLATIEAIPDGVYIGDENGIRIVNKAGLEQLGLKSPAELQQTVTALAHLIDVRRPDGTPIPPEELVFSRALRGETGESETIIRHATTGEERWLRSVAAPIRLNDKVIGAVAVNVDLTPQRRLEREQARLAAALDAERLLLANVLEQLPVGVALVDARSHRLLDVNTEARRIWGDAVGRPIEELFAGRFFHADGRPLSFEQLVTVRAIFDGEISRDFEMRVKLVNDGEAWILVNAAPIRDASGKVVAGVASYVDITERRAAEQRLRDEAEWRERFVGILGHDLRSPVQAISLAGHLLLRQEGLTDPAARLVRRILASTTRVERMIHDLLDFTRTRSGGGLPIAPRPLDLVETVRQAVDELVLAHPDRKVALHVSGDTHGSWDPERMAQVVSNLVSNALSYSPRSSVVDVTLRGEGDQVVLAVRNDGSPIPPALLPRLFDPFRRGQHGHERAESGLGLGLFIAKSAIEAHGGTIEVRSTPTEPTTFTVRLPRHGPPLAASSGGRPTDAARR